ncbi:hypothetical protein [Treponema denticola]|uniref:hypothetical protein n=2 Tax=Treponema denticola TaxID=158 RepID=UPI0001FD3B38|nr:hypothetical protein [Treponema denticola]EGC77521.1 hypothetical protein HMPREF9353_01871 [Treponema denticola F0402]
MNRILYKTLTICIIVTSIVAFSLFIYGISSYFGNDNVVNISVFNWNGSSYNLISDDNLTKIENTINENFNKQKDIFSLLITITSFGIFVISLISGINIAEKTKDIEKYFEELKTAPEKLIKVFYDEIIKKIKIALRSNNKDEALLENIRFITFSPTVYKEDFDLFLDCYHHFERHRGSYYSIGISCSCKLMITVNKQKALNVVQKDMIDNKMDYQYMEAIIPIVGGLLSKEYVFENMINTQWLELCLHYIYWDLKLNDSDLLEILDKSNETYIDQNIALAAFFSYKKKPIVDWLISKNKNIPHNIFNRFFIHSDSDLELADMILQVDYIPDWVKEQMAEELKKENIHINKKWLNKSIGKLKSEILKKWLSY